MTLLDDFSVVDMGEVAEPPDVMPLDWEFRLSGGREIFLTRIQQHRTYGGMLCRLPRDPERTVIRAIEEAQEWDDRFHAQRIDGDGLVFRDRKNGNIVRAGLPILRH